MLSRVAESIYWMSRQVERAENLARFLEVTLNLILDQPENVVDPWKPLVQVTADDEYFREKYGTPNQSTVVQFLAFDTEYPNSMVSCLRQARENARGVREKMSSEAFEQLNEFYHFVIDASHRAASDPTSQFFDDVRDHTLLWSGVFHSTMAQDAAWHFANVGRMLERADKTSRILDVKYFNLLPSMDDVGTAVDDMQWTALLLAISGFEAYQRAHHVIDVEKVVEFFLFNRTFPRSVRHCVASAGWSLSEIEQACHDEAVSRWSDGLESIVGQPRVIGTADADPLSGDEGGGAKAAEDGAVAGEGGVAGEGDATEAASAQATAVPRVDADGTLGAMEQRAIATLTSPEGVPHRSMRLGGDVKTLAMVEALQHRLTHTQVKEVLAGGMHQFVDGLQIELNRIGDAIAEDYFHNTTAL